MRTRQGAALAIFVTVVLLQPLAVSAEIKPGGVITKLGRGATNVLTGWVEIPKRIYETSQISGTAAGLTWGLLRGIGHGFIRTAAGLYEVFTFPYPAPPDYAPLLLPEYVFVDEGITPRTEYKPDYKYQYH